MQLRSFAVGASSVTDVAVAATGALVCPLPLQYRHTGCCITAATSRYPRRQSCRTRNGGDSAAAALLRRMQALRLPPWWRAYPGARGRMNRSRNETLSARCVLRLCSLFRLRCCLSCCLTDPLHHRRHHNTTRAGHSKRRCLHSRPQPAAIAWASIVANTKCLKMKIVYELFKKAVWS